MSKLEFSNKNEIKINFYKKFNVKHLTKKERNLLNYHELFYKIIKNTLNDDDFLSKCNNKLGEKKFNIYKRSYPKFLQDGSQFKTVNAELNLLNYEKIKRLIENDTIENLKDEFYRPIFKILKEVNNKIIEYTILQLLLYEESQAQKGHLNVKDLNLKEQIDKKTNDLNEALKEIAILKNEKEKSIKIINKLNSEKIELLEENRYNNKQNRKLIKEISSLKTKLKNNDLFGL